ncbi:MAG: polysaccharide deacetylase family protein [Chloroflexi bacterium]|nr:polysaccharide deacetylase family protein [Chloroflexota bacterium]
MERDFVGYANKPPQVKWPNGARLAVSVVINYEEGSEYSLLDTPRRELMGEVPSPVPPDQRDLYNESMFEYGSRVGVWRFLDIWNKHGIKGTIFACGLALERNPTVARAFADGGHEICGHGYRWQEFHTMGRDEERENIRMTIEAIRKTTGQRPLGWFTRVAPSLNTRELVAEEGGFIYDSGSVADDTPYYVEVKGKPWLVVPYSLEVNDARFWRGGLYSIESFEQYMRDAFDCLYEEGARAPKVMSIGLHCRIAGTPARSRALDRFLAYARSIPDVWFARRVDIARWWLEHCAPSA